MRPLCARAYVAVGAVLVLLIAGVNLANLVSTRVAGGSANSACAWRSARAVSIWRAPSASRWAWSPSAVSAWRCCSRRGRGTCPLLVPVAAGERVERLRPDRQLCFAEIDGVRRLGAALLGLVTMAGGQRAGDPTSIAHAT